MPAVTLINSKPTFMSAEEHRQITGSTPASFSEIYPVLRHQEEGVSVLFDPPVEGFSPEDSTSGTLYIVDSVVAFVSTTGRGFQVEYPKITLHAISRAESGPCIYCQLEEGEMGEDPDAEGEDDPEAPDMRELKIVPSNASTLENIFEALSQCAALHPDPASASDNEDDAFLNADENNRFEIFTGDGEEELSEVGRAALAHLESIIVYPDSHHTNGTDKADEANSADSHEETKPAESTTS